MVASNTLGRGLGERKIKKILDTYPNIIAEHKKDVYNKILKLDQFDKEYSSIKKICFNVLLGKLHDITRGSTHYYAKSMKKEPYWAKNIEDDDKIIIGNHFFMQVY
jgi:alpha-mannosidase